MLLCTLCMCGDGVSQVVQFGEVRGHGDLGPFQAIVETRIRPTVEVGWQSVVARIVQKFGELSENQLTDRGEGETYVIHGDSNRGTLEVASGECSVSSSIDDWVVHHGIYLPLDGMCCIPDGFHLTPDVHNNVPQTGQT